MNTTESRIQGLRDWREETVEIITAKQTALNELESEIKALQEKLALVDRLLALEKPTEDASVSAASDVLDACEQIIRENREPMHVSQILTMLLERGVAVPGKGTEANVIARFQRAGDRFIRTGRGTYAMSDMGFEARKPTITKQRRG